MGMRFHSSKARLLNQLCLEVFQNCLQCVLQVAGAKRDGGLTYSSSLDRFSCYWFCARPLPILSPTMFNN
jgi:hypothetical protein